jgi:malonyl CoA-acyl carrier protein transacylase
MFFWQGVRCQESMLKYNLKMELDMSQYKSEKGSPSCMATVSNVLRRQLDELIAAFSEKYGNVYLAYELHPGRYTVAGLPDDLAAFSNFLKEHKDTATLRFVPSTIGAHSPFLSYALEKSPEDIQRIGLDFLKQDIKIPVWSNNMGVDLRESDNIMQDVITSYFVLPGAWRKQILPLVPPSNINYVLDFGPGSGVASLTWKHISNSNIQVINCSTPIGRKKFFDEILPSLKDQ